MNRKTPRARTILVSLTVALGLIQVVSLTHVDVAGAFGISGNNVRRTLEGNVREKEVEVERLEDSVREVARMSGRSLVSDPDEATHRYQEFLINLAEKVGLDECSFQLDPRVENGESGTTIPLTIYANCDLAQLGVFLCGLRDAPLIQRVTSVTMGPQDMHRPEILKVQVQVESLSLKDGEDSVPRAEAIPIPNLASADRNPLNEQSPFFVPVPQTAEVEVVSEPSVDTVSEVAPLIRLVGVWNNGLRSEAWFSDEQGKISYAAREMGRVQFGRHTGTLVQIDGESVKIDVAGSLHTVELGQSPILSE